MCDEKWEKLPEITDDFLDKKNAEHLQGAFYLIYRVIKSIDKEVISKGNMSSGFDQGFYYGTHLNTKNGKFWFHVWCGPPSFHFH